MRRSSRLGGTPPADLGSPESRDQREQTERQQSETEPETGSGTAGRCAGAGTRQRRGTARLVVAEQVAERCLLGRSRGGGRTRRGRRARRTDGRSRRRGERLDRCGRLGGRAGEHLLARGGRHGAVARRGRRLRRRAARCRRRALSRGRSLAAGDARGPERRRRCGLSRLRRCCGRRRRSGVLCCRGRCGHLRRDDAERRGGEAAGRPRGRDRVVAGALGAVSDRREPTARRGRDGRASRSAH